MIGGVGTEANRLFANPVLDNIFNTVKGTADNEENISGIDLDKLLLRMLTSTLWRNIGNRTFQDLQQSLLNAFTGNITGNRNVLGFLGDLVNFVNVDDTLFSALNIVISILQQFKQNVLDVFAHITSFC